MSSSGDDDNLKGEVSWNDESSSSSKNDYPDTSIFDTYGSDDDKVSHFYYYMHVMQRAFEIMILIFVFLHGHLF
jgi:hypothetical protein